jgi:Ca2+-binding RTX toxin-like protein
MSGRMITTTIVLLVVLLASAIAYLHTWTIVIFAENIQGTSGDDILIGTAESDTISGFEGNDLILGEGGDDILDGAEGDDEIHGGDGSDEIKDGNNKPPGYEADYGNKVYGGSGNDYINVGVDYTRNDFYYIYGEAGSDYIKVVSNAFIEGGTGDDTIYCTGYECTINGNEGNDEIHVQLFDVGSTVNGGEGYDKVFGKGYSVSGDEGNDYLSLDSALYLKGGEGDDILEVLEPSYETYYNGGPGADTFKCSPGPGDIVEDYSPEEGDTITADCEIIEGTALHEETIADPDLEVANEVDREMRDGTTTAVQDFKITLEANIAVGWY